MHRRSSVAAFGVFMILMSAAMAGAAEPGLVGYWRLAGDCRDSSGNGLDAVNHGADLSAPGPGGQAGTAAKLDGLNHYLEVPDQSALRLGASDFTVTAWVKLDENVSGPIGDIVCKYDPASRKGFNLVMTASSPGYSSISNSRHVFFGIDNAQSGPWKECGKPWPSNPLIGTLIAYDGELYTGLADAADLKDACHMFRYAGENRWVDCGRVGSDPLTRSIYSVVEHKGKLYAGTGTYDWEKAWKGKGVAGPSHVYRYEGGTSWHDCGQVGEAYRILSLASFAGQLYASEDRGHCYRYDGDGAWTLCGTFPNTKMFCMTVYQGRLYGGTNLVIYRYDGGTTWTPVSDTLYGENQVHTLQVYGGRLYAGLWPAGKVLRYEGDKKWFDCGQLGIATDRHRINEVNDLTVYNGKLYAGVIPKAEVWRYERDGAWTRLTQLVTNPKWSADDSYSWNRVPCLTVFQGRLFAGTSTCYGRTGAEMVPDVGRVVTLEAGKGVSYQKDLPVGWSHLAAVRQGDVLKLYADGRPCAVSTAFTPADYDLSNDKPLTIGFGTTNYFSGGLCEVRLYKRALTETELTPLCRK